MPVQTYRITMRSGPNPGKSFPLESEEVFLGRDLSNTITIPDPEVSRYHARFIVQPDGVKIEDQGSTNGTFINGVRTYGQQALKNGDMITFGETIVAIFEAVEYDPDATVVAGQTHVAAQPVQMEKPEPPVMPVPPVVRSVPQARPVPPVEIPQPVQRSAQSAPIAPQAPIIPQPNFYEPQAPVEPEKKKKMATWLVILLILIILACLVVSITLIFMPSSWWCALTFNSLPGCPVY